MSLSADTEMTQAHTDTETEDEVEKNLRTHSGAMHRYAQRDAYLLYSLFASSFFFLFF